MPRASITFLAKLRRVGGDVKSGREALGVTIPAWVVSWLDLRKGEELVLTVERPKHVSAREVWHGFEKVERL